MKIQVLHIDACPNWVDTVERTRDALASLGYADAGIDVEAVLIRNEDDAAATVFGGSPTILVDGEDLFPGATTRDLACRIYVTENGLAGMPSPLQLRAALAAPLSAADAAPRAT